MGHEENLESLKKYISENKLREKYSQMKYDVEADVYFLPPEKGGRHTPAVIGYAPNHLVKDDYLTSGWHVYLEQDYVFPGHQAKTGIKFLTPEVYPHCLEVGMRINVQEASRVIGHATITKICNELLAKKS